MKPFIRSNSLIVSRHAILPAKSREVIYGIIREKYCNFPFSLLFSPLRCNFSRCLRIFCNFSLMISVSWQFDLETQTRAESNGNNFVFAISEPSSCPGLRGDGKLCTCLYTLNFTIMAEGRERERERLVLPSDPRFTVLFVAVEIQRHNHERAWLRGKPARVTKDTTAAMWLE